MKNILVVGNGYDKAKGLKTSFVDFFLPIVKRYLLWLDNKYPDNELDYWVYNYNKATGQDNINKIFKKLEKGCFVEIRDFLYDDKKKKTRRKK